MPLAFPSHQGLIAPLWRRWPRRFDALACSIGAAAPDLVDAVATPLIRGELGQGLGHGLLGLVLLDTPLSLLLSWLAVRTLSHRWAVAEHTKTAGGIVILSSVALGALSHLVFDFLSHGNFLWLYPWFDDLSVFPQWWHASWTAVKLPVYSEPYPIGPHFVVWTALSLLGAVRFFRKR